MSGDGNTPGLPSLPRAPAPPAPDPGALPAGTTLRFLILVVVMMAATLDMLGDLLRPAPSEDITFLCQFAAGFDPGGDFLDTVTRSLAQSEAINKCAEGASVPAEWYGPVGSGAVLLVAAAVYLLLPRWKRRRRGLVPLHERDPRGEIHAEIARLAWSAGLRTLPAVVVDLTALDAGAVVFGHTGGRVLSVNNGLLHARRSDPARFQAVVLHEFAHLRHRDVDIAYAVTALWRTFLVLAALPFTLFYGGSLVAAQLGWFVGVDSVFWPAARPIIVREIAVAAFLFLLVVLARADTLRHRELYADRWAVALGADPGVWRGRAERVTARGRPARGVSALWRSHPSWEERRRVLDDPERLFALTDPPFFLLGVATLLTADAVGNGWDDTWAAWLVGGLAAALLTVSVWRAALYAAYRGLRGPSGLRAGLLLGLGLVCGELLSGDFLLSTWWPADPRPLLYPLLGAVVCLCWLAQCAWLRLRHTPGTLPALRGAVLVAVAAGWVVAAGGLGWWLDEGQLRLAGSLSEAGGLDQHVRDYFPGPWEEDGHYASVLPWVGSVLAGASVLGTDASTAAGAVVLWAYPAVLLLLRARRRGLPSTVLAGLAGGVLGVAAVALAMAWIHPWRPPVGERGGAFGLVYLWWRTVALGAAVAGTAAVVALTARADRLPRALTAAGVAQVVALAGQFLLLSADGCLGPLRVMGETCHWVPDGAWPLTQLQFHSSTAVMFAAALIATPLTLLPRAERRRPRGEADAAFQPREQVVRRSWPIGIAVGVVALMAVVSSVVAVRSVSESRGALAIPTSPPPADTDERVRSFQMLAWFTTSGQDDMSALAGRYSAFGTWLTEAADAGTDTIDGDVLRPLCAGLAEDAATAQEHLGVPDPGLGEAWTTLLTDTRDAAEECLALIDSPETDVQRNVDMLNRLVDGHIAAGRTLPSLTDRVDAALEHWPKWAGD
ncbi:M48 family metalloprotease [Streptomyces sp. NPDC004610]|uniref:M48 family metalloprotease n=1 Tax=unclassified Streptomyces TaxID=2593676 RepID=UPI0033B4ADF8